MRGRRRTRQFGLARFDGDHALAHSAGLFGQGGEGGGVVDAFDVEADGGNARVIEQRPGQFGQANDGDNSQTPVPGVGFDYCWKPAAGNPAMIVYANATGVDVLPAGDYQPSEPFTGFAGCSLNGAWKLRVVDAWGADNGFIFGTSMIFDSSLGDCPIIE